MKYEYMTFKGGIWSQQLSIYTLDGCGILACHEVSKTKIHNVYILNFNNEVHAEDVIRVQKSIMFHWNEFEFYTCEGLKGYHGLQTLKHSLCVCVG